MDLINELINQLFKNTTFQIKIDIPLNFNDNFQSINKNSSTMNSSSSTSTDFTDSTNTSQGASERDKSFLDARSFQGAPGQETVQIPTLDTKSDFFKQFFENLLLIKNNDENIQQNESDDIIVLLTHIENVITTLKKIFTSKQQTSFSSMNFIENYIEMLNNAENIVKSFKIIKSSF